MKLTKTVGPPFAPAVAIGAIASEGKSMICKYGMIGGLLAGEQENV